MIAVPKIEPAAAGARALPGGWHFVTLDRRQVPVLYCPMCAKVGYLDDHIVADDGAVSPSVVCPRDGCAFHDFVRLEGWTPRA